MYEPRAEQKSQGKITVKIIWAPVSNLKKREREKEEAVPNNLQRCRITSSFYDPSGVGRVFPGGHWWMLPLESVLGENLFSFTTCCGCHCFQRTTTLCVCICACVCLVLSDSLQPPWTLVLQAPLSMGFSRQEYWSGLPFPPPGNLPNPGITPKSLVSSVLAGRFFTNEPPRKPNYHAQAATNQYPHLVGFLWLWLILHLNVPQVLKCQNQRWCWTSYIAGI